MVNQAVPANIRLQRELDMEPARGKRPVTNYWEGGGLQNGRGGGHVKFYSY